MRHQGVSIKFVHNRKKETNNGNEFYIQVRITMERTTKYFSIGELPKIPVKYWSGKENKWVKESFPQGSQINSFLNSRITELDKYIITSRINHGLLKFENLEKEFFRKGSVKTMNDFYRNFNVTNKFEAFRTKQAYETSLSLLDEFDSNIPLNSISEGLLNNYIEWEREVKKNKDVTIDKHLNHFKTIVKEIYKAGLLAKNPLEHARLKVKPEKAERTALTKKEVEDLWNLNFTNENKHLEKHRDIFVFQCLTGLYFEDVRKLIKKNLIQGEGKIVLQGERNKNGKLFIIPLGEKAVQLIEKYSIQEKQNLFPDLATEPAFNRSIKTIAIMAKINKSISNKVGRHTFTELAILSGYPRSFVSKMLGHWI